MAASRDLLRGGHHCQVGLRLVALYRLLKRTTGSRGGLITLCGLRLASRLHVGLR
jgi:hypothetical protein